MSDIYQQITQICTKLIQDNQLKKVCDYGCGKGSLLEKLREKKPDCEFTGIDYFRKNALEPIAPDQINYVDKDDFDANSDQYQFDLVVSTFALHHFQYPVTELQRLYHVLKNSGFILIFDHQLSTETTPKIVKAFSSLVGEIEGCLKNKYHRHHYTLEEASDLFKAIPVHILSACLLKDHVDESELIQDQKEMLERNFKIQTMVNQNASDFWKRIWLPLYQLEKELIETHNADFTDIFHIMAKKDETTAKSL